jgi:hypothetical protein
MLKIAAYIVELEKVGVNLDNLAESVAYDLEALSKGKYKDPGLINEAKQRIRMYVRLGARDKNYSSDILEEAAERLKSGNWKKTFSYASPKNWNKTYSYASSKGPSTGFNWGSNMWDDAYRYRPKTKPKYRAANIAANVALNVLPALLIAGVYSGLAYKEAKEDIARRNKRKRGRKRGRKKKRLW